jgi:type I restriction enzyme M protein
MDDRKRFASQMSADSIFGGPEVSQDESGTVVDDRQTGVGAPCDLSRPLATYCVMVDNFNEKADFIWSIADLLRGDYKQSEYQKVILPLTVLRRLDCVTERNKDEVLERHEQLQKQGIANVAPALKKAADAEVYNTSEYTFESLCNDPDDIAENLQYYINQYDDETTEIFDKFAFDHQIQRLDEADLLYKIVWQFAEIDLHPETVPNEEMGYIYEELIRKFNELSNETAGEHFTPREVIELMVNLVFQEDDEALTQQDAIRTVYDPACGTGGMLSVAEEYVRQLNNDANLHVFGQELNPESYAVCNSDMLIKGQEPENIVYGNSFTEDGFKGRRFDYMLSNPPFGVSWKKVKEEVEREHEEEGFAGRFGAGTPRSSDGAFLFLQHMISKMKLPEEGGSRIAIVFNGSPLFNGGPNSGESAIRRWILENDWLEAIVGLPENLFYNTGIRTYIWVLSNDKPEERENVVQLIDAQDLYSEMDESLGEKRHELTQEDIDEISRIFGDLEANGRSKVVPTEEFGYRRIVIDRPLRMSFQATEERIKSLDDERAFTNRDEDVQEAVKEALRSLDSEKQWMDRDEFINEVELTFNMSGIDVRNSVYNAIERALGERNENAEICRDGNGEPEHDIDLRERERVPLGIDVENYFENEIRPYLQNAWINDSSKYHDYKDGELGIVGYEIDFDSRFHEYQSPRDPQEITEEINKIAEEIDNLISGISSQ